MTALSTQIVAPAGFGQLRKGTIYHFMYRDDRVFNRVILAYFTEDPGDAHLEYVDLERFDRGFDSRQLRILTAEESRRMPPWLGNLEDWCPDTDVEANLGKEGDKAAKPTKLDFVEKRLAIIARAVDDYEVFFRERDPLQAMNRFFRENVAEARSLNLPRVRRWLITYLAFARNRWVLMYPTKGRGDYARGTPEQSKLGRPAKHGRGAGWNVSSAMAQIIKEGFVGKPKSLLLLADVYVHVLETKFGCVTEQRKSRGLMRTYITHPQGKPWPSYGQFRYWVIRLLGYDVYKSALIGDQAFRNDYATTQGSYSEGLQDLLEKVWADASQFPDRPRSVLSADVVQPPLKRVRAADGLSGMFIGGGYGFGERERLYKQAIAMGALGARLVGELFGLDLSEEDWPVQCVPLSMQTDQGAGAAQGVRKKGAEVGMSFDMAAAYTPQSDGPIEATNQRTGKRSGQPTHSVSRLTAVEMARQDILDMVAINRSKAVGRRVTPEQAARGIQSPLELWADLAARGRVAGIRMKEVDIVRQFVPPVTFKIVGGRLTRHRLVYNSEAFRDTKFYKEMRKHEGKELKGYAFDISNRLEWIQVDNMLVRVSPIAGYRAAPGECVLNSFELPLYGAERDRQQSEAALMRYAERLDRNKKAKMQTGKPFMPSQVRRGRAKSPSKAAKREAAATWN